MISTINKTTTHRLSKEETLKHVRAGVSDLQQITLAHTQNDMTNSILSDAYVEQVSKSGVTFSKEELSQAYQEFLTDIHNQQEELPEIDAEELARMAREIAAYDALHPEQNPNFGSNSDALANMLMLIAAHHEGQDDDFQHSSAVIIFPWLLKMYGTPEEVLTILKTLGLDDIVSALTYFINKNFINLDV